MFALFEDWTFLVPIFFAVLQFSRFRGYSDQSMLPNVSEGLAFAFRACWGRAASHLAAPLAVGPGAVTGGGLARSDASSAPSA